jgi:hypothetical protein
MSEYQEAKRKLADFEKRIKLLEQRMDSQYEATKKLIEQVAALERGRRSPEL